MQVRFLIILFLIGITTRLHAQVIPANGDTLNYRIVGFQSPVDNSYKEYRFELATGNYPDEKSFEKNIFASGTSKDGRWVQEVPAFGQSYTWRISYKGQKRKHSNTSNLYHFATRASDYSDTSKFRMHVIDTATRYKDMFVILDYAPLMFDMKGHLIWYIPDIPGVVEKGHELRDLKPTSTGTFTLLNDRGAFEFDYKGKVVWRAPDDGKISGDTSEHYHHEFTKLENGHYMISGYQQIQCIIPRNADTSHFNSDNTVVRRDNWFYKKIDCATLIEYDAKGNIVWHWKLSEHLRDEEYFIIRFPGGTYNSNPHLNSFFFDEQHGEIYVSLRNFNRIMKIKYPGGEVLAQYGEYLDSNAAPAGEHLFRAQHCARLIDGGNILLFNNNTDREKNVSSYLQILEQPKDNKENLKKIWEFSCDIDTFATKCGLAGGSVYLLPDKSILAGMGMAGRSFIVSPDKKIIWNALIEYKLDNGTWSVLKQYRTNCILNIQELSKYIFNNTH